ncbi:UDP-N-acetylmuramate dehydrogenase [Vibrio metschnikovii]|uniref:UDP-N-acetylenolpyruvoylglucosamine reductase n=1 Tax=bacterium 19MO03SA05 TaxID=2920620 RepID=A0AAU6VCF2_UNCXX|nr:MULTISPECIES: UDP-N-acetylmuramate dehydrogenase [Vibrio]EKO3573732.1 UDP-N-acetylmuramate dehydrogenase [Vibrio metschnikovii]EKO3590762.1 UDP-N-acetylmuramate dehydrogenase [Vibrio metschnikovii]EKO3594186.1 UDP-N-acetylmuramate dehydrogenase [Vibrio metschnikovii]EKO3608498.1 UDP-N-acetylmuramate dehydrogenase [Vibrio metschnikovii]EKO3612203.1 UDP-N-acetylmuramate dehydrogenase [Vibrio metschnikovii]
MQLHHNANLKSYHTFGLDQTCQYLAVIESVDDLIVLHQSDEWAERPKLMLGKGSNVLFTEPYQGLVMVNRLLGIEHRQDADFHYLHVAGGEDWPRLVEWSIQQGLPGLENLALIPGCAGSAPIQNIGAYGVEFKAVCHYVDYLCLASLTIKRLSVSECQFGYRDSIFKQGLYGKALVVAVGLRLAKDWQPLLSYGPLQSLPATCSAEDIYHTVCQVRKDKLPDPAVLGNAGSFFKNPVVDQAVFETLKKQCPNLVAYPTEQGVKLAAGWLIEQAGLKGYTFGGAQVHPKQALVIINKNNATARDIIGLAQQICKTVYDKFKVPLEHEVRFIGSVAETHLQALIETK